MDFNGDTEPRSKIKFSLTRMEKEEIKELRRSRMTASERIREWSANILRGPLLFGVPILLSMVMLIVLVIIYIVRPYSLTRDFTRTTCRVMSYMILNGTSASCSAGTDPFQPCIKVKVSYPTGDEQSFRDGLIMENEQALVNCNPCSYTFGRHGLLHEYQDACESWKENFDPTSCVDHFLRNYAMIGSSYTCYFNPHNPEQIVRDLTLDVNLLIHAFSWPILACLSYLLAWAFVSYDSRQSSLLNQCIVEELMYQRKKQDLARVQANEWKKLKLSQTLGVRNHGDVRNGGVSSFVGSFDGHAKQFSDSLPSLYNLPTAGDVIVSNLEFSRSTDSIHDLPFDISDGNHFDLRHLDLAVSQQNINDLTTTYAYFNAPMNFAKENGSLNGFQGATTGQSHQTLPAVPCSPLHSFRGNRRKHGKWALVANGSLPNGRSYLNGHDEFDSDCNFGAVSLKENGHSLNHVQNCFPLPPPRSFSLGLGTLNGVDKVAVSEDDIDLYYSVTNRHTRSEDSSWNGGGLQIVNMFSASDESKV